MKISTFVLLVVLGKALGLAAQDTFSIVAVDTLTGEIGSAGASCLDDVSFPGSGGAIIISDLLPGRGAIHTQSFWLAANQQNARLKMEEGLSPDEVLLWLKQNDAEGVFGAQKRQYGIVDFDPQGHPRTAAFTGNTCYEWRGQRTGPTYAIQGNILLGPQILDSMEARFLAATGTLADRLMAALQGANVVGADTRCTQNGTSSLSAFLRVAQPGDADDQLSLDLNVPSLPAGLEPIDSLQRLYDSWTATETFAANYGRSSVRVYPNPARGVVNVTFYGNNGVLQLFDAAGRLLYEESLAAGENALAPTLPDGFYWLCIRAEGRLSYTHKFVWLN